MTALIAQTSVSSLIPVLVGAGISAFVSFSIFVLTQLWLYHKGKSDLLRDKLEEFWKSLIDVLQKTNPIKHYSNILTEEVFKNLNERATELNESLLLPTPYVALYFPVLNKKYSRIKHACGELAKLMRKCPVTFEHNKSQSERYTDKLKIKDYLTELTENTLQAKAEINEMLEYLKDNQGLLIKAPKHAIIAKMDDWSDQ
jgi:uncharacterized membrane protein YgaE (UPF0421/DUF939 family)